MRPYWNDLNDNSAFIRWVKFGSMSWKFDCVWCQWKAVFAWVTRLDSTSAWFICQLLFPLWMDVLFIFVGHVIRWKTTCKKTQATFNFTHTLCICKHGWWSTCWKIMKPYLTTPMHIINSLLNTYIFAIFFSLIILCFIVSHWVS